MPRYQNNCWFFVSLLQKHLSVIGNGTFTFGRPVAENLDHKTRALIDDEVQVCARPVCCTENITKSLLVSFVIVTDRTV